VVYFQPAEQRDGAVLEYLRSSRNYGKTGRRDKELEVRSKKLGGRQAPSP
jgi:hypothetical protein